MTWTRRIHQIDPFWNQIAGREDQFGTNSVLFSAEAGVVRLKNLAIWTKKRHQMVQKVWISSPKVCRLGQKVCHLGQKVCHLGQEVCHLGQKVCHFGQKVRHVTEF